MEYELRVTPDRVRDAADRVSAAFAGKKGAISLQQIARQAKVSKEDYPHLLDAISGRGWEPQTYRIDGVNVVHYFPPATWDVEA